VNGLSMQVARNIADLSYKVLPGKVVQRARQLILDAVGVGLAGGNTFEGQTLLSLINSQGGNPQATVLGQKGKTSSLQAALVNGVFIHSLELDDHHNSSHTHPGAPVVAAALAAAETKGAKGKEPHPGRGCRLRSHNSGGASSESFPSLPRLPAYGQPAVFLGRQLLPGNYWGWMRRGWATPWGWRGPKPPACGNLSPPAPCRKGFTRDARSGGLLRPCWRRRISPGPRLF